MRIQGNDHSSLHAARVCFFVTRLANLLGIAEIDILKLQLAACAHDIGRKNHSADATHGSKSLESLSSAGIHLDEMTQHLIEFHCKGDKKASELGDHAKRMLWILKDADALDRVRTNDLDEEYLRFEESKSLILLARTLHDS